MFGYFRFLNQYSDYNTQKVYKNYYCGLCFALDMHYGALSRMLLSYDMTILAIALHAHPEPRCERLKCMGCNACKQTYFRSEIWKKVAAVNILLAAEKMSDDISDERSTKAAAASVIFHKSIRKAGQDYPRIRQAIREGYAAIVEAEKEKQNVLQIGERFADMMVSVLDVGFDVTETVRSYVREISRWLYFIDAVDDYDEDLKKNRFNPIAIPGTTLRCYLVEHYPQLQQMLQSLYANHNTLIAQLQDGSGEGEILSSILKNSIPSVTSLILHQRKLPELLHCSSGNEWRAKV